LRDVGNQPAHQLVLTEALIFHHWSFAWFEDCPMKNNFKSIQIKKGTMSANIAVILVLYRRHNAEMVVAEACADLVVVHFVHSTLSTLFSLWWNSFWWTCFWRTSFWWRHLQERFLQTHYASDFPGAERFLQTHYASDFPGAERFLQTHYASDFLGALSIRCSSSFNLNSFAL